MQEAIWGVITFVLGGAIYLLRTDIHIWIITHSRSGSGAFEDRFGIGIPQQVVVVAVGLMAAGLILCVVGIIKLARGRR